MSALATVACDLDVGFYFVFAHVCILDKACSLSVDFDMNKAWFVDSIRVVIHFVSY